MEDVEAPPRHFRMEELEGVVKFTPVLPERGKLDVKGVISLSKPFGRVKKISSKKCIK